jgi:GntR family transcriptional repressor for pyruvate dehydrogenase complex
MFETVKKREKVSEGIITQIRDAILGGGLKPGDRLDSEKVLMDKFGVSKASLREALRVLEVMGLIEIRKGVSGGVFVSEVSLRTTITGILNFLHFQPVLCKEISTLRYIIEPPIAQIAAILREDSDILKLKKIISSNEMSAGLDFHRHLVRISKNPLLILVIDFIGGYMGSLKAKLGLGEDFYEAICRHHEEIVDCLISKDPTGASLAMMKDILAVDKYLSKVTGVTVLIPRRLSPQTSIMPGFL